MNILTPRGSLLVFGTITILAGMVLFWGQKTAHENGAKERQKQIVQFRKDYVRELAYDVQEGRFPLTKEQKIIEKIEEKTEPAVSSNEQQKALEKILRDAGIHPGIVLHENIGNFEERIRCHDTIARIEQLADLYEKNGQVRHAQNWRVVVAYFYEHGWDYCGVEKAYDKVSSLTRARGYYHAAGWTLAARRVNKEIEKLVQ